jgi:hypothetical protein
VKWDFICQKKEYGGLGIENMRDFNLCLLSSWINKYHLDDNKIWKMIIDHKYDLSPSILHANHTHYSPFWKGVMWAASSAKVGYNWNIGNGTKVLFWEDIWLGNCSLDILFWDLYVIVNEQKCSVADVWDGTCLKFTFRGTVDLTVYDKWLELTALIQTVHLSDVEDKLNLFGCFIPLGCTQ